MKISKSFLVLTLACLLVIKIFISKTCLESKGWLPAISPNVPNKKQFFDLKFNEEVKDWHGQVWVRLYAQLRERIEFYNYVIDVTRNRSLGQIKAPFLWPNQSKVVYSNAGKLLKEIALHARTTTTVYLQYLGPQLDRSWDSRTESMRYNYLITDYYDWNGVWPLCKWLNQWRWKMLQHSPCVKYAKINNATSIDVTNKPVSIDIYAIRQQMRGGTTFPYLSFVHIVTQATVTLMGQVFASDYEIILPECYDDPNIVYQPPKFDPNNIYEEVFVITQYFGTDYYHKMMEDFPRLAPVLPFLRRNPRVRIHMLGRDNHTDALFKALQLDPGRIVTGNIHALIAYLPRSSPCGQIRIPESQLLSYEYRKYIQDNLQGSKNWNSVVLIKRTIKRGRHFSQQVEIESIVSNLTNKYGLRYELFADNPVPSPEQTMLMFYRAKVIVAPHGAGLSNMIFSRPGTYVIEGISNFPSTVVCYIHSAYHLGHIYHGIPSKGGFPATIIVDWQDIAAILEKVLIQINEKQ